MFIKYPSIDSYKNVVKEINRTVGIESFPVIDMVGTVKVHGTNGGVIIHPDGSVTAQSRNRALTSDDDNAGFCKFVESHIDHFLTMAKKHIGANEWPYVVVYGEWCGGNIQKGVGVTGMQKTFIVFDVYLTDGETGVFVDQCESFLDHGRNIYSIYEFTAFSKKVDFSNPDSVSELNAIMLDVENECPVAKQLNPISEQKTGEGVVWRGSYGGNRFVFKHKGEKHQRGGGSKSIKTVTAFTPEQQSAVDSFCAEALTVDRLMQGMEYLSEMGHEKTMKSTGIYLGWVMRDINKECRLSIDELESAHGIEWKILNNKITKTVREWYFDNCN